MKRSTRREWGALERRTWACSFLALLAWSQLGCADPVDPAPASAPAAVAPLAAAAQPLAAPPVCVTIQRGVAGEVADTFLSSGGSADDGPDKNYGPALQLVAGAVKGASRQALIRFDLGTIPAGAPISSATVTLVQTGGNVPAVTVKAHKVLAPWAEATVSWGSLGGAFDPATAASFQSRTSLGPVSFDVTALVASWQSGALPNAGLLLERGGTSTTSFYSSEYGVVASRPKLSVCYLAGPCAGKANGTSCDDGNACTQGDSCQNGLCQSGAPVVCSASDTCHLAGVCAPATGACSDPVAPEGTSCNDGNACTQVDSCQGGVCTGASPVACVASDACHVEGVCDPATGACDDPVAPDGVACDDGDACTQVDSCEAGACTGASPVACSASDACHVAGVCDPATGACDDPAAPDGAACDDGNACTQSDACQGGACTGASPVVCVASDACHLAGACDPATGACDSPAAPEGTSCSAGGASGTCAAGACVASGTCSDGLQNQGEQAIDCGGPCPACNACLSALPSDGSGSFGWLGYMTVDAQGALIVADGNNNRVHVVAPGGQIVSFGSGAYGYQDGPADSAMFAYPHAVAVDAQHNVFVADSDNALVRKIAPDGTVSTVAGTPGSSGHADGPAASALFGCPTDLELDPQGNLFILDPCDSAVRKLAPNGQVSTYAGTPGTWGHLDGPAATALFDWPSGMTRDAQGNLYVTEWDGATIRKIDVAGQVTTVAGVYSVYGGNDGPAATATFDSLQDIVIDAQGNLLVTDSWAATVRKVSPQGVVSTIAGFAYHQGASDGCAAHVLLDSPSGIAGGPGGVLYLGDGATIRTIAPGSCDCNVPTCSDGLQNQGEQGIDCEGPCPDVCPTCVDGIQNQGELDVDCGGPCPLCGPGAPCTVGGACDSGICTALVCAAATCSDGVKNQGEESADCGGPCPACPTCVDGIQNQGEPDPDCGGPCPGCGVGSPCTQGASCESGACSAGQCQPPSCADGVRNGGETGVDCGGTCAACQTCLATFSDTLGTTFGWLGYLAVDSNGDVIVADPDNNRVLRVTTAGQVLFLGSGAYGYQDGPVADAMFASPHAVAVDAQHNIFVADSGNVVIRKISPTGMVTTVAGTPGQWGYQDGPADSAVFSWPNDLELDPQGNLYIVDLDSNTVRKLDTLGEVTTVAGVPWSWGHLDGPGATAKFRGLRGIARDAQGNLYVSEGDGRDIRKIDLAFNVTTLAGSPSWSGALDGPGAVATFDSPEDLVVDAQGNLLVADGYSATIRKVTPAGVVSTVYGSAYHSDASDGCAASVPLGSPTGIALAIGGGLHLSDGGTLRRIGLGACDCSAPTCFDHIQNQGEQGIDCEGPCNDICPTCTDGMQNGGEYDVDCGGSCPLCAVGTPCNRGAGCDSGSCVSGSCAPPTCYDRAKNQGEVDIDCGGPCPLCKIGTACTVGGACLSGVCEAGFCKAPTCADGVKNQGEVDTDCAGPCPLCVPGTACSVGSACQSGVCDSGLCQPPTCEDGVQNGGEIDADCGGSCGLCPIGKHCVTGGDCLSAVCQGDVCRPAHCGNEATDGAETDLDCGGPCVGCAAGRACATSSDCAGRRCVDGLCGPDPVPTPVDTTLPTDMAASIAFLYTGPNAVQLNVVPGAIDPERVAVAHGRVLARDGAPIADVGVTVLGHPELGVSYTHADGVFDIAVNGGEQLTLTYQKPGLLPLQRQVTAGWLDQVATPDVVMIALDPVVTTVDLAGATSTQIAQGSVMADDDGARQATAMFEPGTVAEMVLPDGTRRALTSVSVRATEFTVGANGPATMPGGLPVSSGYTYAVELSLDQAFLANASEVRFSKPVAVYVDNFLGFPTGQVVPVGYYDKAQGAWVASDNGRIVEILSISGGLADLDIDGSGLVATPDELAALGVTVGERQNLASLYTPGVTLWRSPVAHFSAWDCNWPYGFPQDSAPPPPPPPPKPDDDCPSGAKGSIIECESQVLGQDIPIAGTPFALQYSTRNKQGRSANRKLHIQVSGPSVPASLKRIELYVEVAGKSVTVPYAALPNQTYDYQWDGKDAWGRPVQGVVVPRVTLRYWYPAILYTARADLARSFSQFPGLSVNGNVVNSEFPIGGRYSSEISYETVYPTAPLRGDDPFASIGGFELSAHRGYQKGMPGKLATLTEQRPILRSSSRIDRVAGGAPYTPDYGEGGPATNAYASWPSGVVTGPDGSIYLADLSLSLIRRVTPDGLIHTIAGCAGGEGVCDGAWVTEECGECSDGIWTSFRNQTVASCAAGAELPCTATRTQLLNPRGLAVDAAGRVFVADYSGGVYRIDLDGTLVLLAGSPGDWYAPASGDGGPALAAKLSPTSIALAPDGGIFVTDLDNHRVRRIGPEGFITTVAGNGGDGFSGDGGRATSATIGEAWGVAVAPDGTFYIATQRQGSVGGGRIRRVSTDGIITTVAGNGVFTSYSAPDYNGLVAKSVGIVPQHVAVDREGTVYFDNRARLYRIESTGRLTRVTGQGSMNEAGAGGLAISAAMGEIHGLSVTLDGRVLLSTPNSYLSIGPWKAELVAPPPAWGVLGNVSFVPAGDVVYVFDARGQHLKTVDRTTGATVYDFGYDNRGYLTSVLGKNQDLTQIVRDGSGRPVLISAPGGEVTTLSVGPDGALSAITQPDGATMHMAYAPGSLLTTYTDPRGLDHTFTYDAEGNLVKDQGPSGGFTSLARAEIANGYEVATTTALGRVKHYRIEDPPDGTRIRKVTDERGGLTQTITAPDGTTTQTAPDGTVTVTSFAPDPIWGVMDPYVSKRTVTVPNAGQLLITRTLTATKTTESPVTGVSRTDTLVSGGQNWTTSYDATLGTLTVVSPGQNRKTVSTYDAAGHVVSEARFDVPSGASQVTTSTYDAFGLLMSKSGPEGTTTFTYDVGNRIVTSTNELGFATHFSYDASGRLQSITDPNGVVTTVTHDVEGRVLTRSRAGAVTTLTYDADGQLASVTQPDGAYVQYSYDLDGRFVGKADSAVGHSTMTLDAAGNPSREDVFDEASALKYSVQRTFDPASRLSQLTSGAGQITSYGYGFGSIASITNGLGQKKSYFYDATGVLQQVRDAANQSTFYSYDYASFQQAVTDARGQSTVTQLDGLDRRLSLVSPNTGTTGFTYDGSGRALSRTDARGVTTTFSRDAAGRTTHVAYSTGAPGVSMTYDQGAFGKGKLTGMIEGTGTTSFGYDANDNIVSEQRVIGGVPWELSRTFDAASRVASVSLGGGAQVSYVRDAAGRVIGISAFDGTNSRVLVSNIDYAPFGPEIAVTFGNGVTVSRTLDKDYRLTHLVAGNVLDKSFVYNGAGDLTSITNALVAGQNQAFTYDAVQRLSTATGSFGTESYLYDTVGNRTRITRSGSTDFYNINAASQRLNSITGAGPEAFAYDLNGNALTVGGLSLTYDENNRLASASSGGQLLATYESSIVGRRVRKTDANGNVTVYLYDGLDLLATADGAGNVIEQEVYLDGRRVAVLRNGSVAAADVSYVVNDYRGAPELLLDQAGQVVWRGSYRPFGEVAVSVATVANDLRLPGQIYDPETGFYDNWLRTYDPHTGRYLQSDPAGLDGGVNTYAYVDNRPLLFVDPLGLGKISGSAYAGPGGGGSISWDSKGFSICGEFGVGVGESVEFSPDAKAEPTKVQVEASAKAQIGPIGAEGKVGVETTPCGPRIKLTGKGNSGPFAEEQSKSAPLFDWSNPSTDWENNESLKPSDWNPANWLKASSEAKVSASGCVNFGW